MTLYLSPELTPDEIRKAAHAGIVGTQQIAPREAHRAHSIPPTCPIMPSPQVSSRTRAG